MSELFVHNVTRIDIGDYCCHVPGDIIDPRGWKTLVIKARDRDGKCTVVRLFCSFDTETFIDCATYSEELKPNGEWFPELINVSNPLASNASAAEQIETSK